MKMKIIIEELDVDSDQHLKALLKWENNEELFYLTNPTTKENTTYKEITAKEFIERYQKDPNLAKNVFMIFDNKKPIGNFSIQIDPKQLMKHVKGTSWLGIAIGEKDYWGTGAAQIAMNIFEEKSRKIGATRVELGTFEFNYRAERFYKKLGYIEIGRLCNFTYWNGKYWDDIRMEKSLI